MNGLKYCFKDHDITHKLIYQILNEENKRCVKLISNYAKINISKLSIVTNSNCRGKKE